MLSRCVVGAGIYFGLDFLVYRALDLSYSFRYLVAMLLLLPPGILMGMPFPIGMRFLLKNSHQRANAWAVNGCASVLSAIIAAQIALSLGIPSIIAFATLSYLLAYLTALKL